MTLSRQARDVEHDAVVEAILNLDVNGLLIGAVLRNTLDQLYDGQRTGRYRWDQLYKTEKTHCGTLVEINLQREFGFDDGVNLDYQIAGVDVDCKYSQRLGGWMIPPEAVGKLCLLLWADDQLSKWNIGLVRAKPSFLGATNRDGKSALNVEGRRAIYWIYKRDQIQGTEPTPDLEHLSLAPNVLLQLPREKVDALMAMRHGTSRLNELFRVAQGMRVGRGVVATVAQQSDYMKRIRENGGARTALRPEGIIILGQFGSHGAIAKSLGIPVPEAGESVSARVCPANVPGVGVAEIGGRYWRLAKCGDPVMPAPQLPAM